MSTGDDPTLAVYAEEDITVAATAIGLTLTNVLVSPPPKRVELFVETAQIRVRISGTPTASVGEILNAFDRFTLNGPAQAYNFLAIRTGSTSANLHARYLR